MRHTNDMIKYSSRHGRGAANAASRGESAIRWADAGVGPRSDARLHRTPNNAAGMCWRRTPTGRSVDGPRRVKRVVDLSLFPQVIAGRYTLRGEIGHGGMARVYLADDLATGTTVAVKILHPELAASTSAVRFRREILFLAQLRHPNLLPVLDSGEDSDLLYFVMPYVAGETLTARLAREGPLALDEALEVIRAVGRGVDYAHEHGVIHRDIKPANILLDGSHVLLCDFGIARALLRTANDVFSSSGLVVGTLEYMSPEQAGAGDVIDGRADIYALGCVAFEMLTGELPFRGQTPQVIIGRHLTEPPRSIRSVRPDVPVHVERAIHAAMAKAPARRPQTAGAFIDLLDGAAV
jgi:eukaryotic-like serine/threonine-protein kinase